MQTFVENPHSTLEKAAPAQDPNAMFIHRILVHKKWHSFKNKITHELTEDDEDSDRRIEFCDDDNNFL